jgi:hypothetical protein
MQQTLEEIVAFVLSYGIQQDHRPLYAEKYLPHCQPLGMWQQPEELAGLLHYLQNHRIASFLDIGTFNGATFKCVSDFLTQLNPNVACTTVDVREAYPRITDPSYTYKIGTSADFKEQVFDLVFIDGDHDYGPSQCDFEFVGQRAKFCVLHDISDEFVFGDCAGGGCTQLWRDLKLRLVSSHTCIEFIAADKPTQNMGIGLLIKK